MLRSSAMMEPLGPSGSGEFKYVVVPTCDSDMKRKGMDGSREVVNVVELVRPQRRRRRRNDHVSEYAPTILKKPITTDLERATLDYCAIAAQTVLFSLFYMMSSASHGSRSIMFYALCVCRTTIPRLMFCSHECSTPSCFLFDLFSRCTRF